MSTFSHAFNSVLYRISTQPSQSLLSFRVILVISAGGQMEYVTSFLESSTIHGLSYIATDRKYVRLFWTLVVMVGFTGAGILIYQSFQSWADSPVKTTIETLPITEIG